MPRVLPSPGIPNRTGRKSFMKKSQDCREVDIVTLLWALWDRVWLILLAALAAGIVCFVWARFFVTPTYEASVLMYVNNTQDASKPISNSELSAAQSLVDTYVVILNSRTTTEQVRTVSGVSYSDRELQKMISAQAVNSTEVFRITVTSTDPQEAMDIANTVARVLPSRISDVVEGSSVRVVDYAQLPTAQAAPNVARCTVLGILLGIVVMCMLVVLRELFDNQIRSEDDLLEAYPQIPVLGVIPELMQHTDGYGYGYGNYKERKEDARQ